MMLGLEHGKVRIAAYDPAWPRYFEEEKQRILAVGGDVISAVHHIGSTAVPDMPAKPIIDLMAIVQPIEEGRKLEQALKGIDYTYHPEMDEADKLFYTRGEPTTHHLHFVCAACPRHRWYLIFRDVLIAHPELATEYIHLKEKLALKYADQRNLYTEAKDDFIKNIIREYGNGELLQGDNHGG